MGFELGKRTSFAFDGEAALRLSAIRKNSHLGSDGDVIRAALSAYDDLLLVALSGYQIMVRDRQGAEWPFTPYAPLKYPGLDQLRTAKSKREEGQQAVSRGRIRRKSFVFPKDAVARLDGIKRRSHLNSNSDVIRAALAAYEDLISVVAAGDLIVIKVPESADRYYTPYAPLIRVGLALNAENAQPV